MDYTLLLSGERLVGGLYTVPLEMRHGPPRWMTYFAVEDCYTMAEKANSLGAKTISRTMVIPGTGAFSVLLDPQGAAFAIHQADLVA